MLPGRSSFRQGAETGPASGQVTRATGRSRQARAPALDNIRWRPAALKAEQFPVIWTSPEVQRQAWLFFADERTSRCQQIARTAAMIARIGADLGGGRRQAFRNTLLRLAPAGPLLKVGAPIARWTAP